VYQNTLYKPCGGISFNKRRRRHKNIVIHTDTTLHKNIRISHTSRNVGTDENPYSSNFTSRRENVRKHRTVLTNRPGETTVLRDRHRVGLLASYHPPPLCSNNCSGSGDENYACASNITLIKILLTCTYIRTHTVYKYII
jgi:hypothetical protein